MQQLVEILQETLEWFEDLIPLEQVKLKAASRHNILEMEECMKKEQVAILRLKGMDKKREQLLGQMGVSGMSLKEIIEQASKQEKEVLEPLYQEVKKKHAEYKELSEEIATVLENNIHAVEKATGSGAYSEQGAEKEKTKHFTSRKA